METYGLILCRSDWGEGGWSLHAPDSTDGDIAEGDSPCLASGPAEWVDDDWDAPRQIDYDKAHKAHIQAHKAHIDAIIAKNKEDNMIAIVDATLDPYTNVYGYVTVQVIRDGVVDHDAELPSQIVDICREQWPSPDAKGCKQDVAEARRMMAALGYTVLDGDMQPVEA